MTPPPVLPETLRAQRKAAGHSQQEAAALVYVDRSTWAGWESPKANRAIPPAYYELYLLKAMNYA